MRQLAGTAKVATKIVERADEPIQTVHFPISSVCLLQKTLSNYRDCLWTLSIFDVYSMKGIYVYTTLFES